MSVAQLMADLNHRGVRLEAHGDRLRFSPRSSVTPDLAERMKAHKGELLALLRPTPTGLGTCAACGGALWELPTFDGYLNLECATCGRCFGCRPSTDEVAARFTGNQDREIDVEDDNSRVVGRVRPCAECGSLELWQSVVGTWHCSRCNPATAARRLARASERIRQEDACRALWGRDFEEAEHEA